VRIFLKNKIFIKVTVLLVLACFTGCVTSKIEYVETEKIPPKGKVYRIADVYMKDGKVINLRDAEPKYKSSYKGKEHVITYYNNDFKTKIIELKDVSKVKVEILESNQILTAVLVVGILAILFVLTFFIALATSKGGIAH
jgi:hypothetical protein